MNELGEFIEALIEEAVMKALVSDRVDPVEALSFLLWRAGARVRYVPKRIPS